MATTSSALYGAFTGAGIWKYDGTSWTQVTPNDPTMIAATSSVLYGVFTGSGIWKYDGTSWTQATPNNPTIMTVSGSTLYGAFTGQGIWKYDGTSWTQATPNDPAIIAAVGSTLYGAFAGQGISKYDGTTWTQVTPSTPQLMKFSGGILYGAFAGSGIWKWNGTSWTQVTPNTPTAMAVSGDTVYGAFAGAGIWKYNGTSWTQATPNTPTIMETSPASQQMVFQYWSGSTAQSPPSTTPYEVAIMNLDGTGLKQLTNDGKQKFLPHFSPDATKIVYTKFTAGNYGSSNATTDVAVYDLASGKETMVTSGGNNGYSPWSPDGSRIAYIKNVRLGSATGTTTLMTINADGSNPQVVGTPSGARDDYLWSDIMWSNDNWILFTPAEMNADGSFCKSRVDKIRPDGSSRTKVSDGGSNCTPSGHEAIGDSDPGWSSDSKMIYSGRGFPNYPAGGEKSGCSERKLYSFSSDAWTSSKVYNDLSLPSEPSCAEGVPRGSPDGKRILLWRGCFDTGTPVLGIYVTDTAGSYRTLVTYGFGPDWNPVAK